MRVNNDKDWSTPHTRGLPTLYVRVPDTVLRTTRPGGTDPTVIGTRDIESEGVGTTETDTGCRSVVPETGVTGRGTTDLIIPDLPK